MPKFRFNKLVRDKLPRMYAELNQKIVTRRLTGPELLQALQNKLMEEAAEIPFEKGARDEIVSEIADLEQVIDDMKVAAGISDDEVRLAKLKKLEKKGGFSEGVYVDSIELEDGDEWVEYYRREPKKYPEE